MTLLLGQVGLAPLGVVWAGATNPLAGLLLFASVVLFDGLLLWSHVRAYHLTWQLARRPLTITLLLLVAFYTIGYGMIMLVRNEAVFVGIEMDAAAQSYTLTCMCVGAGALVPFLTLSALWRGGSAPMENLRDARATALRLFRRFLEQQRIESGTRRALLTALETVRDADAVSIRLRTASDASLLDAWQDAAKELHNYLVGIPSEENLRRDIESPDVRRRLITKVSVLERNV